MSVGARIKKFQLLRARVYKVYCQIIWDDVNYSNIAPGYEWTCNFQPVKNYTAVKTCFWVLKSGAWPQPPWLRYRIYTSPDGGAPTSPILADVTLTLPTLSTSQWTKIEFEYDPVPLSAGINYRHGLRNAGTRGFPPWYYYIIQAITHYGADNCICPPPGPGYTRWWTGPYSSTAWEHHEIWVAFQTTGYQ